MHIILHNITGHYDHNSATSSFNNNKNNNNKNNNNNNNDNNNNSSTLFQTIVHMNNKKRVKYKVKQVNNKNNR